MSKNIERVGTVVFGLLLAWGWAWTNVLKQQSFITDSQQFKILIGLTALLAVQQIYLVWPKPVKRGIIEKRKIIIESQLTIFLDKYYKILEKRRPRRTTHPTVRVNVMLPTKRWRGVLGTYLKIYYFRCPDKVIFTGSEFSLKWRKGEGTCGSAWSIKRPSVFDSVRPELKLPAKSIPKEKIGILKSIKCTMSIPIWLDDSVVGILNLDSKQNIDDTLFLDNDVLVLANACADSLSGQFDYDGVEG